MKKYHILNGDALKDQFPNEIEGEIIVARECMIEGPIKEKDLKLLFQSRANFIADSYGIEDYSEKTIPELNRITQIEKGEVNLWFEEDLFCQTNLWFVCSLLYQKSINVYLVMPNTSLEYGFSGLDKDGLVRAYKTRKKLTQININQFALLWFAYRNDDIERLLKLGVQVHSDFPFVMNAIEAHFDRNPQNGGLGKPAQIILDIMKEKKTEDFKVVFREFSKRAPIYGFGDIQVKRIFDELKTQ
ncbi:DUF1835 domain-containing protein [Ekhidna sp.]|uniref:DUF1835 domain-containing protein n=1 Tax=Ekhidna sp. TaxID=2608089 RepID=UPI003CCB913B